MYLLITCLSLIFNGSNAGSKQFSENILSNDSTALTLYIFTGSDWCSNCKRLEKNVLNDSNFMKSMKEHGIQINYVDFPQRKKLPKEEVLKNTQISDQFGFKGSFPTLVLNRSGHSQYRTFFYINESASSFTTIVLEEMKRLNE